MFHVKCICWKIFEQTGIGMAYLHVFLIPMYEIDTFRTFSNIYVWAFFAKIVNALRKKTPS